MRSNSINDLIKIRWNYNNKKRSKQKWRTQTVQKSRGPFLKNGSKATLDIVCKARSDDVLAPQTSLTMGELVELFW